MKERPRRLRYHVAISLNGFIVPSDGKAGLMVHENIIFFDALYAQCDTFVMGRKTYECILSMGEHNPLQKYSKESLVVASKTLKREHHPGVTIVSEDFIGYIANLKKSDGRDIWLMGGQLVGPCLDAGILDSVETAIMPMMLGKGARLVGESGLAPLGGIRLELVDCREWETSGIIMCKYNVGRQMAASLGEAMFC
ncbi:riboflavin biosynthesis protein RibD domain-containing protein [Colletotrichum navitas]|uniref:2,5-diamino-6-ribosylamino-4(3H)-pyrimidinone 5'-phosphate reductase n=1 Tax=Colletotrichum navitas TaxID=681940 RepID=A0AAD8V0V3_9PEZI|nr:riboflavin biosynthesis protein RibD domain-containing protein [Colletotrichum navitas]KAK1573644.1 riboflavin biosynthesis protein RibD domain-containing protein [Colletotrichum navitas]